MHVIRRAVSFNHQNIIRFTEKLVKEEVNMLNYNLSFQEVERWSVVSILSTLNFCHSEVMNIVCWVDFSEYLLIGSILIIIYQGTPPNQVVVVSMTYLFLLQTRRLLKQRVASLAVVQDIKFHEEHSFVQL